MSPSDTNTTTTGIFPQGFHKSWTAGYVEEGLRLLVFGDGVHLVRALEHDTVVGRSRSVDLRVNHATVSRRHAAVRLGPPVTIADLGSGGGLRRRGEYLVPGRPYPLDIGDVIEMGGVFLMLQGQITVGTGEAKSESREQSGVVQPVIGAKMTALYRRLTRIATSDISVLILGETGVGKELVAEAIHRKSGRADRPLVRINCAAFTDTLFESELFGYEKGAFSGAIRAKPGILETANGGTVVLDEVGELSSVAQAKLLRVIAQREVLRVGSVKPQPIDVRLVSSTNRLLARDVAKGTFRADLYYRLCGVKVEVPPLRQRVDEIKPLAIMFVADAQPGHRPPRISEGVLTLLEHYSWPGNVRELRNYMESASHLCEADEIHIKHLPDEIKLGLTARQPEESGSEIPRMAPGSMIAPHAQDVTQIEPSTRMRMRRAAADRASILEALLLCHGNRTQTARLLGISRRTLFNRMKALNIDYP